MACILDVFECGQHLQQRLSGRAGLGDRDGAGFRDIEAAQALHEGARIEIIVEAQMRGLFAARYGPASELSQRLPAEARSAGSEDDHGFGALGKLGVSGGSLLDVVLLAQDAEVGEAFGLGCLLQSLEARCQEGEPLRERALSQARAPNLGGKSALNRLAICHGANPFRLSLNFSGPCQAGRREPAHAFNR